MIAFWMLYTFAIGLLVSVVAAGLSRAASALHRPTRFIWAAALVVSMLWPAGMMVRRAMWPPAADAVDGVVMGRPTAVSTSAPRTRGVSLEAVAARVERPMLALWAVLSALLLTRLAMNVVKIGRARAQWTRREVDGVDVRLSSDVGPAVVGVREMDVVIPEWILSLDRPLLSLVLRHEEEHRTAGDPYLLFFAAIAVVLMPWNAALWWQTRRLRFAIEIDCDRRVLRADPRPERYGMLLLTIAQRRSSAPSVFAPMLTEPTSQLERRIDAMRVHTISKRSLLAGVAVSIVAFGVACAMQSPDSVVGPRPSSPRPTRVNADQVYFEFQVEKAVSPKPGNASPRYPDMLRTANVEGEVLAQFVVGVDGKADMSTFKTLKATHPLFTETVVKALPDMVFFPADVGGHAVKQLVQMPFQFNLSGSKAAAPYGGVKIESGKRPAVLTEVPVSRSRLPLKRDEVLMLDTQRVAALGVTSKTPTPAAEPVNTKQTFFEFQLTHHATLKPNNPAPRYPDMLRSASVEGEALVQFVVNADGTADASTFKVLKATHPLFAQAVKDALPQLTFDAAQVDGKPVRQLMQMPFTFSLPKQP